jgi:23S rRNA pseudouridine1911/1915/1917 synthase
MAKLITERKHNFTITDGKKKERLDLFITNNLEHSTRSKVQKLIKNNLVVVNGIVEKSSYIVVPGDKIEVTIPVSPRPEKAEAEDIPIDVVYEDDDLLIVNKPPGIVVHPALGNYTGTLVNALMHHTQKLSEINESTRAGIVHRIDKDTSGLLLVAKDEWVHSQLAKQFFEHSIERTYQAICWGRFKDLTGEVIANIGRSKKDRKLFGVVADDEGKHAHTFYKVLEEYDFASLVELKLKTGRTHQIRVHMSYVNHPIFGDASYGGRRINAGSNLAKLKSRVDNLLNILPRQALHAKTLGFVHPRTKEKMLFDSKRHDFVEKPRRYADDTDVGKKLCIVNSRKLEKAKKGKCCLPTGALGVGGT